jgi:uroporphyrinogen-III synthase
LTAAPPRIIVTRPAHDAAHWVQQFAQKGLTASALPLIHIGPVTDPALVIALQQARSRWNEYRAAMFVSGNAATYFFEQNLALAPAPQAQAAIKTRAWAPGPGTARALMEAGMPPDAIDGPAADAPQFDSEALWKEVHRQVQPGDRVLIVRGRSFGVHETQGSGRDWLARQIEAAGAKVDFVVAYERGAPRLSAAERQLANDAASDGSLWLLSSSEAVAHLASALPLQDWRTARAIATHPRIAQAAREAGFGDVRECRPAFMDVVASIESGT